MENLSFFMNLLIDIFFLKERKRYYFQLEKKIIDLTKMFKDEFSLLYKSYRLSKNYSVKSLQDNKISS